MASHRATRTKIRVRRALAALLVVAATLVIAVVTRPAFADTATWHVSYNDKCVDADRNRIDTDGARIQLWTCNGSAQQSWTFNDDGTIHVGYNGHCLDADTNTAGRNGTVVQLWTCNGSAQQRWSITNGIVRSGYSGRCLDADLNTIATDGARIQLWDCNDSKQQHWYGLFNGIQNSSCPQYSSAGLWTTSTDTARVRVRVCFQWDQAIVRPLGEFQVDWPSTCTAGVPWAFGCSIGEITKPRKRLSVYAVHFRMSWTDPTGAGSSTECTFPSFTTSEPAHSSYTLTCNAGWMPTRFAGDYTITLSGIEGDVKDDGEDWKSLPDFSQSRRF